VSGAPRPMPPPGYDRKDRSGPASSRWGGKRKGKRKGSISGLAIMGKKRGGKNLPQRSLAKESGALNGRMNRENRQKNLLSKSVRKKIRTR